MKTSANAIGKARRPQSQVKCLVFEVNGLLKWYLDAIKAATKAQ